MFKGAVQSSFYPTKGGNQDNNQFTFFQIYGNRQLIRVELAGPATISSVAVYKPVLNQFFNNQFIYNLFIYLMTRGLYTPPPIPNGLLGMT